MENEFLGQEKGVQPSLISHISVLLQVGFVTRLDSGFGYHNLSIRRPSAPVCPERFPSIRIFALELSLDISLLVVLFRSDLRWCTYFLR